MIEIDKDIKLPKPKPTAHQKALMLACSRYREAYEIAYIRTPNIVVKENGMVSIDGKAGVSLKRLKVLTEQLRFRKLQE